MNNQGEGEENCTRWQMQSCGRDRLFIDGRSAVHMVISASGIHHESFCTFLTGFFGELSLQIVKVTGTAYRNGARRRSWLVSVLWVSD
jgi:hypothetical protein